MMIKFILLFLLFAFSCCDTFYAKEKALKIVPSNIRSCATNSFYEENGLFINCIDVFIENNSSDTIWIEQAKERKILCDFDFYYTNLTGGIAHEEYLQDVIMDAFYSPIPPNESEVFNSIFIVSNRLGYNNYYIKLRFDVLVKNRDNANIGKLSKRFKASVYDGILYKPEFLFFVEKNKTLSQSAIDIDSIWRSK